MMEGIMAMLAGRMPVSYEFLRRSRLQRAVG